MSKKIEKILEELKRQKVVKYYSKCKNDSYWGTLRSAYIFVEELRKKYGAFLEEWTTYPTGFWVITGKGMQNLETPMWKLKMNTYDGIYRKKRPYTQLL